VDEQPKETQGFHDISVTESDHQFYSNWWSHGHIIRWMHTFVHELTHFLDAFVNQKNVAPYRATFEDGNARRASAMRSWNRRQLASKWTSSIRCLGITLYLSFDIVLPQGD
jgi:hypothetical protein